MNGERRGDRTPGCRYHCGACQRHFASIRAFDGHRVGDHSLPNNHEDGRRCSAPFEDARFGSEIGFCAIGAERVEGVTIYFLVHHREGVGKRLHGYGDIALGVS